MIASHFQYLFLGSSYSLFINDDSWFFSNYQFVFENFDLGLLLSDVIEFEDLEYFNQFSQIKVGTFFLYILKFFL